MKIYEFDPVIYPTRLWVAVNPDRGAVEKTFGILDEDGNEVGIDSFHTSENSIAQTYSVYHKKSKWKGCFVCIWKRKDTHCGVIAHESSHCADWLDDEIGGLGGVERGRLMTGEPRAYYIQWVANSIDDVLRNRV